MLSTAILISVRLGYNVEVGVTHIGLKLLIDGALAPRFLLDGTKLYIRTGNV